MGDEGDAVNAQFHEAYDGARTRAVLATPVLVVLEDRLVLVRGGGRTETPFTTELFRIVKTVAHTPVAAFAIVHGGLSSGALDRAGTDAVARLRAHAGRLDASLVALVHGASDPGMTTRLREIITTTVRYLERVSSQSDLDPAALMAFATTLGPALLRCTEDATEIQLAALHAAVTRALSALDEADHAKLEVVVAGAHQARMRSLPMQYFQKVLGEPRGAERRVTYAEGVTSVDAALLLVGTRCLDRAIASAFFGNPARLQRDILGDAAQKHLETLEIGLTLFASEPVEE